MNDIPFYDKAINIARAIAQSILGGMPCVFVHQLKNYLDEGEWDEPGQLMDLSSMFRSDSHLNIPFEDDNVSSCADGKADVGGEDRPAAFHDEVEWQDQAIAKPAGCDGGEGWIDELQSEGEDWVDELDSNSVSTSILQMVLDIGHTALMETPLTPMQFTFYITDGGQTLQKSHYRI